MPYLFSTVGFSSTRTAGSALPPTNTWPTPSTCESFCCRIDAAASYMRAVSTVSEVSARMRMGASAGLTLRYFGLFGRFAGSWPRAALIAACTSRAAPSMYAPLHRCTDSSVNSGFPVYSWEWEKDGAVDLELKRSPDNLQAWEMVLGSDEYTVSTFAPTKSVGTVNDPITNEDLSVYRIESGALEGVYLLDKRYKDGSGGITLQTGAFAEAGGLGSELDKTGSNFLLSYPLYGLLYAQGAMCLT